MNLLWVAFYVVVALFAAALAGKIVRRLVRGAPPPPRAARWDFREDAD